MLYSLAHLYLLCLFLVGLKLVHITSYMYHANGAKEDGGTTNVPVTVFDRYARRHLAALAVLTLY